MYYTFIQGQHIYVYTYSKPYIQHSLTCTKITASQFAPCCVNVDSESEFSCWVKVVNHCK